MKRLLAILLLCLVLQGCFQTPLVMIGNNQQVYIEDNDEPVTEGNTANATVPVGGR